MPAMGLRSACGSRVEIGDQDVRRVVAEVSPAPEALSPVAWTWRALPGTAGAVSWNPPLSEFSSSACKAHVLG